MSATQRFTGKALVIYFEISGGGTVTLSGDQTALDVTGDSNTADLTAGADVYTYTEVTTHINSATIAIKHIGENGTASWGQLQRGTKGQLYYYPAGTAAGKPKGGFPAVVKSKTASFPYADAVTLSIQLEGQGGAFGTTVFDPTLHVVA